MFGSMKIKTRILSILAVLAGGYLLLLAMVQISATSTHSRMSTISSSLFPSALKMQHAQASFERMKKHYGDAVVLQDANSLKAAEEDAEATASALGEVKTELAFSPELSKVADSLVTQFSSIRSRDHDTYAAILGAKDGPSEELMAQVGVLGKDNKVLTDAMAEADKTISASFQTQLDAVDASSVRSQMTGVAMLGFMVLVCAAAWWVIQSKVVRPLHSLAERLQAIAEGDGDLTRRIEVNGHNEIDEVAIGSMCLLPALRILCGAYPNTQRRSPGGYRTGGNSPRDGRAGCEAAATGRTNYHYHERNVLGRAGDQSNHAGRRGGRTQSGRDRALRRQDCAIDSADDWRSTDLKPGDLVQDRGIGQVKRRHRPHR